MNRSEFPETASRVRLTFRQLVIGDKSAVLYVPFQSAVLQITESDE